jgi:hypothetical protein
VVFLSFSYHFYLHFLNPLLVFQQQLLGSYEVGTVITMNEAISKLYLTSIIHYTIAHVLDLVQEYLRAQDSHLSEVIFV